MKIALAALAAATLAVPAVAQAPAATPVPAAEPAMTPDNLWHLDLSNGGTVVVALRPDKAPNHVARIKQLTRAGFYDGLAFHRVIEGFMAQGGDPQGTGAGGSPLPDLKAEFNDLPHVRGALSMARAASKDSANSQFFITFMPVLRLDNTYTVLGRVQSGMAFVDAIKRGEGENGAVAADPTRVVRAWIEADGRNASRVPLPVAAAAPPAAPAAASPATGTTAPATPPPSLPPTPSN